MGRGHSDMGKAKAEPCRKSLRTGREAQVKQEDDRCTAWSERERIGDRVVSEGPEQSRLKRRKIGAPDTN